MKSIAVILLALFAHSVPVFSQNAPPPLRPVQVQPPQPGQPQPYQPQQQVQAAAPTELDENISITLTGTLAEGLPIAVTLTGCGLQFQSNINLGSKMIGETTVPVVGTLGFLVSMKGDDYLLSYSIGARLPVATSTTGSVPGGARSTNIEYESTTLTGVVKCVLDKDVRILESGNGTLALKVTKP